MRFAAFCWLVFFNCSSINFFYLNLSSHLLYFCKSLNWSPNLFICLLIHLFLLSEFPKILYLSLDSFSSQFKIIFHYNHSPFKIVFAEDEFIELKKKGFLILSGKTKMQTNVILLDTTLFVKLQVTVWLLFDDVYFVPLASLESVNVIIYPVIMDVHY